MKITDADIVAPVATLIDRDNTPEDFWSQLARNVVTRLVYVFVVAQKTPAGANWRGPNGTPLYHDSQISRAVTDSDFLVDVLRMVLTAMRGENDACKEMGGAAVLVHEAVEYLTFEWLAHVHAAPADFVAEVRDALRALGHDLQEPQEPPEHVGIKVTGREALARFAAKRAPGSAPTE